MSQDGADDAEIDEFYLKVREEAESGGYHLNQDEEFTKSLLASILVNKNRYGYGACPCRLASGKKEEDLDIICPCDYRDPDLEEFNACYCGLYVSMDILGGKTELKSIPERRPAPDKREENTQKTNTNSSKLEDLTFPIWRCRVCGYLCAREEPPETCPICKVDKERFERFV
ncbi:MAG TPA: ferredoxin-thioredoxin reductase catalytic domain-containing protein [Methanobacterium sp.]|nr:ferredoxin-thioredoxin reductase catalytic domain-containing protein [Methanobacterium sp.]